MYEAKIRATKEAIVTLENSVTHLYFGNDNLSIEKEYKQIIDDLKVTLRNYEYAQRKYDES